jgi:hypothetical protein
MIPRIPVSRLTIPTDPTVGSPLPLRLHTAPTGDGSPAAGHGALDGAWWPRSRNLAAELPGLVAGLDAWLDAPAPGHGPHISRVSINLTAWDAVPAHLDRTGRRVRVSWFGAIDAHTLSATCSDGTHLDLLVIPPQATPDQARAATAVATDPANALCGAAILARLVPALLRDPDPTPSWSGDTDQAARDRRPGGPAHLLDDGDPDETDPGSPATAWRGPVR